MALQNRNKTDFPQIHVKFVTKQEIYAVPNEPFALSGNVTCSELNTLLNELVRENSSDEIKKKIEFDFLVQDEFLRTSLYEHLQSKDISTEDVVNVEYLQKFPTPKPENALLHDDWVSAIDCKNSFILSGCYDGTIHLWTSQGKRKLSIPTHKGSIKAVGWVTLNDETGVFVTGGQKQVIQQWKWYCKDNVAECVANYHGHERSVESIAVNPDSSVFASTGWDALLKIWPLTDDYDGPSSSKKGKLNDGSLPNKTPRMTMKGHRDSVTRLRWYDESLILSSSMDHTLRLWDIEEGGIKQELPGNKAFLCCDIQKSSQLILASSSDRHVRLYDPRSSGMPLFKWNNLLSSIVKKGAYVKEIFTSHNLWVQGVAWSPKNDNIFVSGSFDKLLKMWDTRSPRAPLFDLSGHEDKILTVYYGDHTVLSGSADNTLRLFSVEQ